jgi:hypothetical protein
VSDARVVRILAEFAVLCGWGYGMTLCESGRSVYCWFRKGPDRFKVRISDHGSEWFKPDNQKRFSVRVGRGSAWASLITVLTRFQRVSVRVAKVANCSLASPERGAESGLPRT